MADVRGDRPSRPTARLLGDGRVASDAFEAPRGAAISDPPALRQLPVRAHGYAPPAGGRHVDDGGASEPGLPSPTGRWYDGAHGEDELSGPEDEIDSPAFPPPRRRAALRFCLCRAGVYALGFACVLLLFAATELVRLRNCAHGGGGCFALELVEVGGLCAHEVDYLLRARVRNPLSLSVHLGEVSVVLRAAGSVVDLARTRLTLGAAVDGGALEPRVPPGLSTLQAGPAKLAFASLDALAELISRVSNGSSVALELDARFDATVGGLAVGRRVVVALECARGRCTSSLFKPAAHRAKHALAFELRTLTVGSEALREPAAGGGADAPAGAEAEAVDGLALALSGALRLTREPLDPAAPRLHLLPTAPAPSEGGSLFARNASVRVHVPRLDGLVYWHTEPRPAPPAVVAVGSAGARADARARAEPIEPRLAPLLAVRMDAQTLSVRLSDLSVSIRARAWVPQLGSPALVAEQRRLVAAAATRLLAGQVDSSLESGSLRLAGGGGGGGGGGGAGGGAGGAGGECALQVLLDRMKPFALTAAAQAPRVAADGEASRISLVDGSAVIDLTLAARAAAGSAAGARPRFEHVRASLLAPAAAAAGSAAAEAAGGRAQFELALDMALAPLSSALVVRGTFPACSVEVRLAGVRVATLRLAPAAWPRTAAEPLRVRLSVVVGDLSVLAARIVHALRTHGAAARRELALSLSGLDEPSAGFVSKGMSAVRVVVWRLGARAMRDPAATAARKALLASDAAFYRKARWWEPSFRAGSWSVGATSATSASFQIAIPPSATPPSFELSVGAPRVRVLSGRTVALELSTRGGRLSLPTPPSAGALNVSLTATSEINSMVETVLRGEKLLLSLQLDWQVPREAADTAASGDAGGTLAQRVTLPLELPALPAEPKDEPQAIHLADGELATSGRAAAGGGGGALSAEGGTWQVLAGKPKIIWGSMMSTLLFWEEGVAFEMQLPLHNPLNFEIELTSITLSATFNDPDGASTFLPDAAVPLVDALHIDNLGFVLRANETALSPKISIGLHTREVETLTRVMNEVSDHQRLCADLAGTVTLTLRHGSDVPFAFSQPFSSPRVSLYGKDEHACDFMAETCEERFVPALGWPAGGRAGFEPFPRAAAAAGGAAGRPVPVTLPPASPPLAWRRYSSGGAMLQLHVDVLNASAVPLSDSKARLVEAADPFVQVSVGCDGKQCTSCAHCVATTVVSNAQEALWHERLRFGVVSAEELITLRLLDWDTQYAEKLLLAYSIEPPWPPSGALIEVRSTARFGEEPTRLFARLGYTAAATPEPQDGARLLHDGSERLVVTHLAEQAVRVSEGFEVRFQVTALSGAAAAALRTSGLDPVARPIPETEADGTPPTGAGARLSGRGSPQSAWASTSEWAVYAPAPAFSLLLLSSANASARAVSADALVGDSCGVSACPGCAGIADSVALSFDRHTVRLYVGGKPTYQRAGVIAHAPLDDGRAHTVAVRFDLARKQLTVVVDDAATPAIHEALLENVLEPLLRGGGYARVGFTAGSGSDETRPLVLNGFSVSSASASAGASVVSPAPADGYVGRVGLAVEFTLRSFTACGLPSPPLASWQVMAQGTSSAMEGSLPRGELISVSSPPVVAGRGETAARLHFVPQRPGIYQILIRETAQAQLQFVGEVLVLPQ